MSAQPLSLREEAELRSEVDHAARVANGRAAFDVDDMERLLATLDEARQAHTDAVCKLLAAPAGPATVQQPAPTVNDSPVRTEWCVEISDGYETATETCASEAVARGRAKFAAAVPGRKVRLLRVETYEVEQAVPQ